MPLTFDDPAAVARSLDAVGYLADPGISTTVYLGLRMGRPIFLEGDPGVGKTALAHAIVEITGTHLIRLSCYEGIDAAQALYSWNFPRQILSLRAARHSLEGQLQSLYSEEFLVARPLLQAIQQSPCVLLIDEIDRADDEFEALLLELLAENAVTIPEIGTIRAQTPPIVVLTSNRTREVHDALKRRCLYHWVDHPDIDREIAIVRRRLPEVSEELVRDVATIVAELRTANLVRPPGVSEAIDWAHALHLCGAQRLTEEAARTTLGAALKNREDVQRVVSDVLPRAIHRLA